MPKFGIVLGSTRKGRAGEEVAQWVAEQVAGRDADYELVDLEKFDVPILSAETVPMAADKSYEDARVQEWSDAIDQYEGFIFVTPEYNHSVPGPFKNAVDSLGAEWKNKPVGFVGYSYSGGKYAIEAWKPVVQNFKMPLLGTDVNIDLGADEMCGAEQEEQMEKCLLSWSRQLLSRYER